MTTPTISLLPLDATLHCAALQAVYVATPSYWARYGLPGCPPDQAARELAAVAAETPGRSLLGILKRAESAAPEADAELIGVIDFRRHWPETGIVYMGMLMVAEPYQRCGVGRQAWQLLRPWLAGPAQMTKARVGVEQFNPTALQFWASLGFALTGASDRVKAGEKLVRLLYMELNLLKT